jgi:hypothetical protein
MYILKVKTTKRDNEIMYLKKSTEYIRFPSIIMELSETLIFLCSCNILLMIK